MYLSRRIYTSPCISVLPLATTIGIHGVFSGLEVSSHVRMVIVSLDYWVNSGVA